MTEQVLCLFVSHLAQQGLKHRSIKVYLSAVRHLQIEGSYPDSFGGAAKPKLEYVLRGGEKARSRKRNGSMATPPHHSRYTLPDKVTVGADGAYMGHKNGLGSVLSVLLRVFMS